jgi:hypothetical protein
MTTTSKLMSRKPVKACDSCGLITTRLILIAGWKCCADCEPAMLIEVDCND